MKNEKKEFIDDVAELFVMLEGVTEELRGFGGDDRTQKIIKGSLELLSSFRKKCGGIPDPVTKPNSFRTVFTTQDDLLLNLERITDAYARICHQHYTNFEKHEVWQASRALILKLKKSGTT